MIKQLIKSNTDGVMQDCSNSMVDALGLPQDCIKDIWIYLQNSKHVIYFSVNIYDWGVSHFYGQT